MSILFRKDLFYLIFTKILKSIHRFLYEAYVFPTGTYSVEIYWLQTHGGGVIFSYTIKKTKKCSIIIRKKKKEKKEKDKVIWNSCLPNYILTFIPFHSLVTFVFSTKIWIFLQLINFDILDVMTQTKINQLNSRFSPQTCFIIKTNSR